MNFFRSVSELSYSTSQNLFSLVKLLAFAVDVDEVEEDAGALFHAKLLAEVCAVLASTSAFLLLIHLASRVLDSW